MSYSPYSSPTSKSDSTDANVAQPVGVTLLGFLHGIFGALAILICVKAWIARHALRDSALNDMMMTTAVLSCMGIVSIGVGLGLWRRKWWGWWAALSLYFYSLAFNALQVASIAMVARRIDGDAEIAQRAAIKFVVRMVILILLIAYLQRSQIRALFRIAAIGVVPSLAIQLVLGAGSFALVFAAAALYISKTAP